MENRLKELRKANYLTLAQLAEKSTVAVSTINSIERGTEPKFSTAILIAWALGVPATEIFPVKLPDN